MVQSLKVILWGEELVDWHGIPDVGYPVLCIIRSS